MKIGIISPSPVPFTIGGAENLMWGLCDAINQLSPHQCELIKLPSREHTFWDLIEDYYQFYNLDVSHFDVIIAGKYPAWMVRHHRPIYYMLHCLRGLYDTYHMTGLPEAVRRGNPHVDEILDYMGQNPEPLSLDDYFQMLFHLKKRAAEVPAEYFAFPGPFIRKIVHYMDHFGLSQTPGRASYAISDTVRKRTDYFPEGEKVDVIYPPTSLKNFTCEDYRHIFMVSRLDGPKRIDMLIRAMKYVKSDVQLLIAGTGPKEAEWKKMASGDPRIRFLGFVKDEDVESYYANSLVIPYFPYDEDFGLITLEAMLHKKPVITTVDAGGPTEFVVDYETGFVTPWDPKAIAAKIEYFIQHPEEAKRMGENAYEKVKGITWEATVKQLLETLEPDYPGARKKITVTSTFPIYPPMGGGQSRIYNIYRNVAKYCDVEIVSFAAYGQPGFKGKIAPGLYEIRIPQSEKHREEEYELEKKVNLAVTDIAMIPYASLTPEYENALRTSIQTSNLVVASHPYLYRTIEKFLGNKPMIYEAHNVESLMKKGMLPDNAVAERLVKMVHDVEKDCCDRSCSILTCGPEDQTTLAQIYQAPTEKMVVVPNGVDTSETKYTPWEVRQKNKAALGLGEETIALFMGSWHQPNLEACEKIFEIAEQCPDVKFMLMGSQCRYFENRPRPANVGLLGLVDEEQKNKIFATVDVALNPMLSGSGTNLKMFDYMSAGIPVITTAFGARGIDRRDVFFVREVDEMAELLTKLPEDTCRELAQKARSYVEQEFDWKVIAKRLTDVLDHEM